MKEYIAPITLAQHMQQCCLDVSLIQYLPGKTTSPTANTTLPADLEVVVDGEDDEKSETNHQSTSDGTIPSDYEIIVDGKMPGAKEQATSDAIAELLCSKTNKVTWIRTSRRV